MNQPTSTSAPKSKQKKEARDLRAEATKIANSIKIDGQTPAETKSIANGIQRGMEIFLRQQSEKTRELDKRTKKVKQLANQLAQQQNDDSDTTEPVAKISSKLPWILLGISWLTFITLETAQYFAV